MPRHRSTSHRLYLIGSAVVVFAIAVAVSWALLAYARAPKWSPPDTSGYQRTCPAGARTCRMTFTTPPPRPAPSTTRPRTSPATPTPTESETP